MMTKMTMGPDVQAQGAFEEGSVRHPEQERENFPLSPNYRFHYHYSYLRAIIILIIFFNASLSLSQHHHQDPPYSPHHHNHHHCHEQEEEPAIILISMRIMIIISLIIEFQNKFLTNLMVTKSRSSFFGPIFYFFLLPLFLGRLHLSPGPMWLLLLISIRCCYGGFS